MNRILSHLLVTIFCLLASCSKEPVKNALLAKAEQGDPVAQIQLAEKLLATNKLDEAFTWLTQASESGDNNAKRKLANLQAQGKWANAERTAGVDTLETLARKGDTESAAILGEAYERGSFVKMDTDKAKAYYSQAAEQGHLYSKYRLALAEWLASDKPVTSETATRLKRESTEIAQAGEPRAYSLLARILDSENKVAEADTHHLTAAQAGEPHSMYRIGLAYHRSVGDPKYGPLGYDYLSRAEEAGYTDALMPLALANYHGNGTSRNRKLSLQIGIIGAWLGDQRAVNFMLLASEGGDIHDFEDVLNYRALLSQRYSEGDPRRGESRGVAFKQITANRKTHIENIVEKYKTTRSSGTSSNHALKNLLFFEDPLKEYTDNRDLVMEGFTSGDPDTMYNVALSFLDEESPNYDKYKAIGWLKDAAIGQSREAALKCYELYAADPTDPLISPELATSMLHAASAGGHKTASLYLAVEYKSGVILSQNFILAANAAGMAIDKGNQEAKAFLREMVMNQQGIQMFQPHTYAIVQELANEGLAEFRFLNSVYSIVLFYTQRYYSTSDSAEERNTFVESLQFDIDEEYKYLWNIDRANEIEKKDLPEEIRTAVDDIWSLASEDNLRAMQIAATWHLKGIFTEPDKQKASKQFEAAWEVSNFPDLAFEFAISHFKESAQDSDLIGGSTYMRRAAEVGHEEAATFFSDLDGENDDKDNPANLHLRTLIEIAYQAEVLKNPEAMFQLAIHYRESPDFSEEYSLKEYKSWLSKATTLDNMNALVLTSSNYIEGNDVDQNIRRALRYMRKAADLGNPECQYAYGYYLSLGLEIKQNLKEGIRYLKLAADQGFADATALMENLAKVSERNGINGTSEEDILQQLIATAIGQDTFPLKPHLVEGNKLITVENVSRGRPQFSSNRGLKIGKQNQDCVLLADLEFHPAKIRVAEALLTVPTILLNGSLTFRGKRPSINIRFSSNANAKNAYALLLQQQDNHTVEYKWQAIGQLEAGKITDIEFALSGTVYEPEKIVIHFFADGQEMFSNIRFQALPFLNQNSAAFIAKRFSYIEANSGKTQAAQLSANLQSFFRVSLHFPPKAEFTFKTNEFGYIISADIAQDINPSLIPQILTTLPFITFYPALKNGTPVNSKIIITFEEATPLRQ